MISLQATDFIALDDYCDSHPLRMDMVYTQKDHKDNIFKTALYKPNAKMWGHRELAEVVLRASEICYAEKKQIFEIKDFLRPVEAQMKMKETDIIKANPQWEGRLLSRPGGGGHPRGMAVDIILLTENGDEIDMGTPFDYFAPDPDDNAAHRDYMQLDAATLENRRFLERCMLQAAAEQNREVVPFCNEWWDFRFTNEYFNQFAPISEADLPEEMKMTLMA